MSKYQKLKDAIETFQPNGADGSILYASTELNEKGFKAILGRNLKSQRITTVVAICVVIILTTSTILTVAFGHAGAPSFATFLPIFIVLYFYRSTLIVAGDEGLDFYFTSEKFGGAHVVYDKMTLSYDKVTDVKTQTGRRNTRFVVTYSVGEKTYKIKITASNGTKKIPEQAGNMEHLRSILEKIA